MDSFIPAGQHTQIPTGFRSNFSRLVLARHHKIENSELQKMTWAGNIVGCWLILEGGVQLTDPRGNTEAEKGDWVFISSQPAKHLFQKNTRLLSIRFLLEYPGGRPFFERTQHRTFPSQRFPQLEDHARQLAEVLLSIQPDSSYFSSLMGMPPLHHFQLQAAFYRWMVSYMEVMHSLGESLTAFPHLDPRVEKAVIFMDHQPLNLKFKEGEIAQHVGLSVNQLLLLFRKEIGITPFEYFNQRRILVARNELMESARPIKELAFDLGFGSPSHFSTWFKKITNRSPREYRNAAQEMTP
ncbi:helix-turn-helix transcriptional regulator [Kiritimatiellaeota bacterium B1221]|nr:helix-turn-helix transcriptional regulator [Kiritimatiellaeota bacterium B1221]